MHYQKHLHVHIFSLVIVEELVDVFVRDRVPGVCKADQVIKPTDNLHLIAEMDCCCTFVVLPHCPRVRQG